MVGAVLPFERLRALARYGGDDRGLVIEAADCLADFAHDTTQLVTVCRRLLAHHPSCGPLWWLCARIIAAPDPSDAARESIRRLETDRTAARLSSLLPFPHDEPVAVLGWPEVVSAALGERPDLDVVVVRSRSGAEKLSRRLRTAEQPIRVVAEPELLALAPSHLLIEASAAGGGRALVPTGAVDLAAAARSHGARIWLVAGLGRVLPERLFESLLRAVGEDGKRELMAADAAERIVGPSGVDSPPALARRMDCSVAPELLRLAG